MCGIIGVFDAAAVPPAVFDGWRDRLLHRGPDQGGSLHDRGLHLGFRRLAILDLSEAGHQPMRSPDGRHAIVFNGEIYNFGELRADLEGRGAVFRGHSDTEVLLALLTRDGPAALSRLNGMFALALYDAVDRTVLLARDRLGVKPLYLHRTPARLAFASELAALREVPGVPEVIDPDLLAVYFRLGFVPEWAMAARGLGPLPPGTWRRLHLDAPDRDTPPAPFWDLPPVGEVVNGRDEDDWVDEIEALLDDATRLRLRADVPLGVFLSGGIDSGLVAAMAARHEPGIGCFTVSFAGQPEDETPLAAATARMLGLRLETLDVDLTRGMRELPAVMAHFDTPFADASALPTALICQRARQHLTVVLTGDAGDEVFAGYGNHLRAWRWRHRDAVPGITAVARTAAALLPRDSRGRRLAMRAARPVGRFGIGGMLYPFEDWQDALLVPALRTSGDAVVRGYDTRIPRWHGASALDLSQRVDLRSYLLDDILVKVDRMSMRHALELRSPFLDYRLIELGLRVPSALRVKEGHNKYLLRRLATRYLPASVVSAPKRGFGIPLRTWLRDPANGPAARERLLTPVPGAFEPFVPGGAARLWDDAMRDPARTAALTAALAYRWWSAGRAGA
ncbi:MAG: asparagine synthase (glutamine-hydrolyzing) [Gemmatimonadaceae bacterium]|nr:asparagine synthase (glutamine-hydrolyzing) [Gemmatimonadaceae bacterium]